MTKSEIEAVEKFRYRVLESLGSRVERFQRAADEAKSTMEKLRYEMKRDAMDDAMQVVEKINV